MFGFPLFFWSFSFGEAKEKRAEEMQELRLKLSIREAVTLKTGLLSEALKNLITPNLEPCNL
jgi:hypothetical protein